jgi:hypothetical protein
MKGTFVVFGYNCILYLSQTYLLRKSILFNPKMLCASLRNWFAKLQTSACLLAGGLNCDDF